MIFLREEGNLFFFYKNKNQLLKGTGFEIHTM